MAYLVRVIWASIKKDCKIALADRTFTIISLLTPVTMFLLMSVFMAESNSIPVAAVMLDSGPYAQRFYTALSSTHTLSLQQVQSSKQADDLLRTGHIVAIITMTQELDQQMRQQQPVKITLQVNNLNTSFTDVFRRAIATSIVNFYVNTFPTTMTNSLKESDVYAQDINYMQYLAVPILIFGCMISNITQAGIATANDWEKQTIKEDLLSPAASWMIIAGKMLSSFLINAIAMVLILILLVVVLHIQPVHWGAMVGLALLCSLLFISMGTLLGTLFKRRKDVTILSLVFSFPLFFLCSPFVPLAFNGQVLQAIAQFIPTYYAINLLQHAVHGFPLNGSSTMIELGILCSYVFLFMLLSTLVLRRSVVAH